MVFIALLRGINVGGNNKVEMHRLKTCMEKAGFKNVSTYINSGNVIFSSDIEPKHSDIESLIENEFGFYVPAIVRSFQNFIAVSSAIPADWTNDSVQRTDVMFLWDDINRPDIVEQFKINPDIERLLYVDGALVWNIERQYVNRGQMIKIIGTEIYKKMTIRNINTVRKLTQMIQS